ncbi:uncharacterized protein P7C73_g1941, partial [Tremellales sp. Uapishka_1]
MTSIITSSLLKSSLSRSAFAPRSALKSQVRCQSTQTPATDLQAKLREGLKTAMKSRDKPATTVLKAILADITYNAKASSDPNAPPSNESIISAIRKGIDKRVQAADSYAPGGASPHAENHSSLQSEIDLLKTYLPPAPSSDVIQTTISGIISSLEKEMLASKGVTGHVMKNLWEKLGDSKAGVDKKEIGKWVTEALKKMQL